MPTPGELLAAAVERTGLDDFGDDSFREGLEILTGALSGEARIGRFVFLKGNHVIVDFTRLGAKRLDKTRRPNFPRPGRLSGDQEKNSDKSKAGSAQGAEKQHGDLIVFMPSV